MSRMGEGNRGGEESGEPAGTVGGLLSGALLFSDDQVVYWLDPGFGDSRSLRCSAGGLCMEWTFLLQCDSSTERGTGNIDPGSGSFGPLLVAQVTFSDYIPFAATG